MAGVNFYSIKVRLILWLVVPMTLLGLMALLVTSSLLSSQANQVFDRMLLGAARSVEQRLVLRDGQVMLNMPYFTLDVMESASAEKIFYRVERANGELLAGFKGLKFPRIGQNEEIRFYNTVFAGNDLRAVFIQIPGATPQTSVVIAVAESLQGRQIFAGNILDVLTIMALLTVILTMITAVLAVHKGLSPLNRLSESIKQRSEHDLRPLKSHVPAEVQPLVDSINALIQRIKDNIEHIQHFNADVSHQLRTPLAEIKTLTELAQQELTQQIQSQASEGDGKDYAPQQISTEKTLSYCRCEDDNVFTTQRLRFQQIEQITDFLSRTTQQLLSYAKTRQSLLDQQMLQPLRLSAFCKEQVILLAPRIYQQGGELEFISEAEAEIFGDSVMLTGLLTNLIDNALLYGLRDGAPGLITVSVGRVSQSEANDPFKSGIEKQADPDISAAEFGWLSVQDQGPGIAEGQLQSVTERFVRLDQQSQGSGLGLAIVRQICEFHQARLELINAASGGLKVTIRFPLAEK